MAEQYLDTDRVSAKETQEDVRTKAESGAYVCRNCGSVNRQGDQFCGDCGAELGRDCPACGKHVGFGDFCEACGYWMHEGKCRFCYATLSDGSAFCEDCGCSQSGLLCTVCHSAGFFDFCSRCGLAVSERAADTLNAPVAQGGMVELLAEMRSAQKEAQTILDVPEDAVEASPELTVQVVLTPGDSSEKPTFVAVQELAGQTRAQAARAPVRKRVAQEQLKQRRLELKERLRLARERLKQVMQEAADQTFEDGQQARVHSMALRKRLIDEGYNPTVWRCNRYNCEHPSPNDCAAPQFGGFWVIDPDPRDE